MSDPAHFRYVSLPILLEIAENTSRNRRMKRRAPRSRERA